VFFYKKTNDTIYESGKILLNRVDSFEFMGREYASLKTVEDQAVFHFLVNRPWRDTAEYFYSLNSKINDAMNERDKDVVEFAKMHKEVMLGNSGIELFMKLKPLPKEVRNLQAVDYSRWSRSHTQMLKLNPETRVWKFVSISSQAAAHACLK
jgi:hypothetical protein